MTASGKKPGETVVLFIALLAAIVINADAFYDFLARPRKIDGSYEDEPEVANAPDNGEPMAPRSKNKFLAKLGW